MRDFKSLFGSQPKDTIDPTDPHRDWRMIESIVADAFTEQKKARRWSVFFKSLMFLYLFGFAVVFIIGATKSGVSTTHKDHVGVVRLEGVIAADEQANGGKIGAALRKAFENERSKAVILAINSPGGSPVQSGYIYDEMKRLRAQYPEKKLYAVIADTGASGGYYAAVGADEIYANKASIVGSIGVTAATFGFVETLEKLGVERRIYTAGEHKAFLDQFSPESPEEKAFFQGLLTSVHQQFREVVLEGRGDRLKTNEDIFSGLFWDGQQALELGLIDGLGSVRSVARDVVGLEEFHDYTIRDSPFKQLLSDLGVSIGKGIASTIQQTPSFELR